MPPGRRNHPLLEIIFSRLQWQSRSMLRIGRLRPARVRQQCERYERLKDIFSCIEHGSPLDQDAFACREKRSYHRTRVSHKAQFSNCKPAEAKLA